jgi:dihydrofolate reductase
MMSLDGYFEGPNQDLNWHHVDDEFNQFAVDQLNETDTILFGRVTYQMMERYWTTPAAVADDPIVTEAMNRLTKVVFSRTLDRVTWKNTRLVKDHIADEINRLKQQPGKDIAVFGSAALLSILMEIDLIDEYRLMVNPVVLGRGNPLFKESDQMARLKLLRARTFRNGNVLLYYEPVHVRC